MPSPRGQAHCRGGRKTLSPALLSQFVTGDGHGVSSDLVVIRWSSCMCSSSSPRTLVLPHAGEEFWTHTIIFNVYVYSLHLRWSQVRYSGNCVEIAGCCCCSCRHSPLPRWTDLCRRRRLPSETQARDRMVAAHERPRRGPEPTPSRADEKTAVAAGGGHELPRRPMGAAMLSTWHWLLVQGSD